MAKNDEWLTYIESPDIESILSRSFDTLTHFRKFYPLLDYPRHVPDPKRRRR